MKFRLLFIFVILLFFMFAFNCYKIFHFSSFSISSFPNSFHFVDVSKEYFGRLKIPKINLNKGFYSYSSPYNNVDKGLELINDYVSLKNGIVLASHSGNSNVSFFKDLYKISIGDYVYISFGKDEYTYKVTSKYETLKNGYLDLPSYDYLLVLTTCSYNDGKQLVICCTLL